jgi:RHS repeat-associated protein
MELESESLPGAQNRPERRFLRNAERNRLHEVVLRTPTPAGPVEAVERRYTWDAAGFATSRDGVPIEWDATGQLARFGAARFERDAEGKLRAATIAGVTSRRRFGGLVEADATGRALRIDLGGVAIDLVANRMTYRHFDWRGNVRSVWDASGALVAVREYGAYGLDRSHGDAAGDPRGFAQGLETAGLVVLGARVYDPDARQFLSPDPVYSAFHQHVYAAGDPANYWDRTGRSAEGTVGYQVAGAIGEGFGMAGGFVVGLALGVRSGNGLAVMALAGTFAAQGGRASRGFVELLYGGLYDLFTAPADPTSTGTHGGSAPLGPLQIPAPISGPSQPEGVCNGECYLDWDGNRGDGYPGGRGSGSIQPFSFAPSVPAVACGLTGFEPLAVIAFALGRRRVAGMRRSR